MQTQILLLALVIFVLGLWLQLAVFSTQTGWQYKKPLSYISIFLFVVPSILFLLVAFSPASVLFALVSVYMFINILRIVAERMNDSYLRNTTERTFYWLASMQLLAIILWIVFYVLPTVVTGRSALIFVCLSLAFGGTIVLITSVFNITKTRPSETAALAFGSLPTVTLAIAARNENLYLQKCLQAALNSDYQKLEIVVYDDCSQDHTADIIKSFAHDGVRFVQGEKLPYQWLAKNLAYQTLLDEASGELIIYMGVDVILEPNSITKIVEQFTAKDINMMGIMPKRTKSGLVASIIQPMRYWNELALPRFVIKHEPVLSSCWVAKRSALIKAGAFKAFMQTIVPEEHLSTTFAKNQNGYSFVRSSKELQLSSNKSLSSQWKTALRIRYPQAHRRPEYILLRVLIEMYFLIAPFILLPMLVISQLSIASLIFCSVAVICLIASSVIVAAVTNRSTVGFSLISFPIVVLTDFIALHISMYRYEFGEVVWKGRDVAPTSMHVIPHLPEI